ncbi:MAG TPA: alpha/beta fold hydrolase [Gemmatimonadales bacterium]|nr:alpha/beta fold hydrolase [Gemmatimonadales bacterium]
MATPILSRHALPGILGDILIDVRSQPGPPRPAVVILHGFKGFKDWGMFPAAAERLARAGFTAVSLNVSGSGVDQSGTFVWPERFGHNTFTGELTDVLAVIDALDQAGLGIPRPTSVGVVGHSRGGGTAILAARRRERIAALVTWASVSSVARWSPDDAASWRKAGMFPVLNKRTGETLPLYTGLLDDVERNSAGPLNIQRAATELRIPWLIVHGTADESVGFREAEDLAAAAPRATSRLLAIEGGNHGFGAIHPFAGPTPELERVLDETTAWFSRHLP